MKYFLIAILFLFPFFGAHSVAEALNETDHYEVVNEYVRSLGNMYEIQQRNEREIQNSEFTDGSDSRRFMTLIKQLTRKILI